MWLLAIISTADFWRSWHLADKKCFPELMSEGLHEPGYTLLEWKCDTKRVTGYHNTKAGYPLILKWNESVIPTCTRIPRYQTCPSQSRISLAPFQERGKPPWWHHQCPDALSQLCKRRSQPERWNWNENTFGKVFSVKVLIGIRVAFGWCVNGNVRLLHWKCKWQCGNVILLRCKCKCNVAM